MGRTSSIRRLPPELRQAVEEQLMNGRTLDEIVEHVRALGGTVSRSAVHRYGKGFADILARAERSRMLAQMLVNSGRADTEDKAARAGVEMLHGLILSAIEGIGEKGKDFTPGDAMKLAVALSNTMRAAKAGAELEKQRADNARSVIDAEAQAAPENRRIEVAFVQPRPSEETLQAPEHGAGKPE